MNFAAIHPLTGAALAASGKEKAAKAAYVSLP
jgi:hypothetical protein